MSTQSLSNKLEEEKSRSARLSSNLQTSERLGANHREEAAAAKAELAEAKRKLAATEQSLAAMTGNLQKSQDGLEGALRQSQEVVRELEQEVRSLQEELLTERAVAHEMAEQKASKRVSQALEEAKCREEEALSALRERLHKEGAQLRQPLEKATAEAREEAERWKVRFTECDAVRKGLEEGIGGEERRVEALMAEVSQLQEELEKQKQQALTMPHVSSVGIRR